ncbi:MAG: hypothetical protein IJF08_09395 [Clostridia bacterium]|nr:hypothetical protein [Clostridia bacterium]
MKRVLLALVVLVLCISMLASCDGIKEQQSISKLDELEEQLEQKGYECSRMMDTGVNSYAESLVADSGLLLKGKITGMMEYVYEDESTGKHMLGIVVGTTHKADALAIGEIYVDSLEAIAPDIDYTAHQYYVQIEYTLS